MGKALELKMDESPAYSHIMSRISLSLWMFLTTISLCVAALIGEQGICGASAKVPRQSFLLQERCARTLDGVQAVDHLFLFNDVSSVGDRFEGPSGSDSVLVRSGVLEVGVSAIDFKLADVQLSLGLLGPSLDSICCENPQGTFTIPMV